MDVELSANALSTKTKALIDTGSPRCVFPRGVGDLLAVEFGHPTKTLQIMGHTWTTVSEPVVLSLEPFPETCWETEVDFVVQGELPFALLGYEGFLNKWAVSFNGSYGYFVVEPPEDFHTRQPALVVQRLKERWPDLLPTDW